MPMSNVVPMRPRGICSAVNARKVRLMNAFKLGQRDFITLHRAHRTNGDGSRIELALC